MSRIQNRKTGVQRVKIDQNQAGRRIDNYLMGQFRDLPKTRIYQMLRKGEIRVNKGRIKQTYRLQPGDELRIPPITIGTVSEPKKPRDYLIDAVMAGILYEDEFIIALNKPGGIVVHSGSGRSFGIIEILRYCRPELDEIQLVHRLDRETSGCLLLSKQQRVLSDLQQAFIQGHVEKHYTALLLGRLTRSGFDIDVPLDTHVRKGGERLVAVDARGKQSLTRYRLINRYAGSSLVDIQLFTGRTHQIRVHSAHMGHPVAGDDKYGIRDSNKEMRRAGLKRLFLHSCKITLPMPWCEDTMTIEAPLPDDLDAVLQSLV